MENRENANDIPGRIASKLKQSIKECIDFHLKDFRKSNQFADLDIHAIGLQLGIGAFGYDDTHEI